MVGLKLVGAISRKQNVCLTVFKHAHFVTFTVMMSYFLRAM